MAQLKERLLLAPEEQCSNPVIDNFFKKTFVYCPLDANKRGRELPYTIRHMCKQFKLLTVKDEIISIRFKNLSYTK